MNQGAIIGLAFYHGGQLGSGRGGVAHCCGLQAAQTGVVLGDGHAEGHEEVERVAAPHAGLALSIGVVLQGGGLVGNGGCGGIKAKEVNEELPRGYKGLLLHALGHGKRNGDEHGL